MNSKTYKIDVVTRPNAMITVIGRDMGAISATEVEAVIDYSVPEAKLIVSLAKTEKRYQQFIADDTKIKSLIIMTTGTVYPSSFRMVTLNERIKEATTEIEVNNIVEKAGENSK